LNKAIIFAGLLSWFLCEKWQKSGQKSAKISLLERSSKILCNNSLDKQI
jgi:hypothetical protein